jgi:hypothetical protein
MNNKNNKFMNKFYSRSDFTTAWTLVPCGHSAVWQAGAGVAGVRGIDAPCVVRRLGGWSPTPSPGAGARSLLLRKKYLVHDILCSNGTWIYLDSATRSMISRYSYWAYSSTILQLFSILRTVRSNVAAER